VSEKPVQRTSAPLRPYRNKRIRPEAKNGTRYGELQARVAVRLVQIDLRRNPDNYKFAYLGVQLLADRMRDDKSNPYTGYWYLISLAKWLCEGRSMAAWVVWASTQEVGVMRAIHKRPFSRTGMR
jgi:hypothetical protein